MAEVCKAMAHGSLMGARGNSGVILSQLLRGLADAAAGRTEAGPAEVAEALVTAAELAYQAVVRPVEGTILTVARAAGEGATAAAPRRRGPAGRWSSRRGPPAAEALARTPEQLDGAGPGRRGRRRGHRLPAAVRRPAVRARRPGRCPSRPAASGSATRSSRMPATAQPGDRPEAASRAGDLRYEVMYLLDAPDDTIAAFKEVWAGIGDSIVVVGGDGLWNCHIHTDDIGAAIEAGARRRPAPAHPGHRPSSRSRRSAGSARGPATGSPSEPSGPPPTTGVVAVVTGEGIGRIFRSLGVHHQVRGRPVDEPVDRPDPRGGRGRSAPTRWSSCPTTTTSSRWPSRWTR